MPEFRITFQSDLTAKSASRNMRSHEGHRAETVTLEAEGIADALIELNELHKGGPRATARIVTVEEMFPKGCTNFTDKRLTKALCKDAPEGLALDRDEFHVDDGALHLTENFEQTVLKIAEALDESGLVPGLSISPIANPEGYTDFAMVEMYDSATGTYRSVGRDSRRLIGDRDLAGWPAVLSVARTLIETVEGENLL
jgi:hypothetical protein